MAYFVLVKDITLTSQYLQIWLVWLVNSQLQRTKQLAVMCIARLEGGFNCLLAIIGLTVTFVSRLKLDIPVCT